MTTLLDQLPDAAACHHALATLQERQSPMLETVQDWSRVNSGSRNLGGIAAMTDLVTDYAAPLGCKIELIDLPDTPFIDASGKAQIAKNAPALKLSKHSEANRKILLTGHLDTVFPEDSPFQSPKFLADGTLNGPGVADMKGGILVMLEALRALEASPLAGRTGWEVLLSPDEETGSLASADMLTAHARSADIGMTYEPALPDGTLAGARKGSGNFTLVVEGRSAHAGRSFFDGRNAVVKLATVITALSGLTGSRPGLTLNAAVISGGVAPNVVPDLAYCRFNVRLEKAEDGDFIQDAIAHIIAEAEEDGFTLSLHGGINRPPKVISDANTLLMQHIRQIGAETGLTISYQPTGGCCEGNNLAAAGLPNVDTLGVQGGLIHSEQEFLVPESLSQRARLSAGVMMAFAAGLMDDVIAAKQQERQ